MILGIFVNEHLFWNFIISELCKRIPGFGDFLNYDIMFQYLPLSAFLNQPFHPFLIMALLFWGLTLDTYLEPLFLLQKKTSDGWTFTTPSAPIFRSLRILKLADMIQCHILTVFFKAINKLLPIFFRIGSRQTP